MQINFRIPSPDPRNIDHFVDAQFGFSRDTITEPAANQIKEIEQILIEKLRSGISLDNAVKDLKRDQPEFEAAIDKAIQEIHLESFDNSENVKKAARLASLYLGPNPRKIKRFLNIFRLKAMIANRRGLIDDGSIELEKLAKMEIVEMRWPDAIEIVCNTDLMKRVCEAVKADRELKDESSTEDEKRIAASRYKTLVNDPAIKRLVNIPELADILGSMCVDDSGLVPPCYYFLSRVVGGVN